MRSRAAVVTATLLSVLLGLAVLLGCLFSLVTFVPSAPCPNDTIDSFRRAMTIRTLLSALMTVTALLSIAVARWGVSRHRRNPWPWLAASMLGLVIAAALVVPIDRLGSC
ncbi:hypothetical protein [Micromonospora sagamiensis]|nr:hypothetical protein [Micromonospora sagamiensis]